MALQTFEMRKFFGDMGYLVYYGIFSSIKEPTCQCRSPIRDAGSIPGSGRSPGGGHDNPLQYSRLENPMVRGGWQAVVHRVAKELNMTKEN